MRVIFLLKEIENGWKSSVCMWIWVGLKGIYGCFSGFTPRKKPWGSTERER